MQMHQLVQTGVSTLRGHLGIFRYLPLRISQAIEVESSQFSPGAPEWVKLHFHTPTTSVSLKS